jgi:hypothetical protein
LRAAVAGSLGLIDNFPLANAHLVDRLQQQGALVLAKTAMGEFAFFPSFCISRQARLQSAGTGQSALSCRLGVPPVTGELNGHLLCGLLLAVPLEQCATLTP